MPALRGHHLICLQFFRGEGYNAEFVENLRNILKSADEYEIDIRTGADDVCGKCPYLDRTRCRYSEGADEGIAEMDSKALALLDLSRDIKVRWEEVRQRLPELFPVWHTVYCAGCSWRGACEKNDFYLQLKASLSREA
jgi:hypothetical protein